MHRLLPSASLLLAACAAAQAQTPVHGDTPGHTCKPFHTERFIGQRGTSAMGAVILKTTNAAVLRWAPVGTMLTMDYRADRVTVRLDLDGKVTAISCG